MASSDVTAGLDETQIQLLQEECILINNDDEKTGSATKKACHLLENIEKGRLFVSVRLHLSATKNRYLQTLSSWSYR